jgi:hypothetical protein
VAGSADDDVVKHGDSKKLAGVNQTPRDTAVFSARGHISGRVIVGNEDGHGARNNGRLEHLARGDGAACG